MTITRERQSHHPEWQADWRGNPRTGERSDTGICNLHRQHAGCSGIILLTGEAILLSFSFGKETGAVRFAQPHEKKVIWLSA